MPPFAGNDAEADALAAFIVGGLHGKEITRADTGQGEIGKALFENNCAACHGIKDLAWAFEETSRDDIVETLSTLDQLSDDMMPFEGSKEEFDQLSNFLFSLNNEGAGAESANIDGAVLFGNNCTACHSTEGMSRRVEDWDRTTIREALDKLDSLVSVMPPYEGSPEEKEVLTDYLNSLKGE